MRFFSCSQMRASGTAINSASAAQVMLFCLFSDKCFKCENRKLLINKRHEKSQFQLSTNEKEEFHRMMSGTLEMLPFISRNKSLSHSRVEIQLLLLLCFYLVSKIHSLCQRLSTHTRWLVSFKGILLSLKSHSFKCYSFFEFFHATLLSKTGLGLYNVHVGRFWMVINVRAFWNASILELFFAFWAHKSWGPMSESDHHKPHKNESIRKTLLLTFTCKHSTLFDKY